MPVGLVVVITLMTVIALATVISFASLRIAPTMRLGHRSRMSLPERWVGRVFHRGARLSLIPEIGPPLLATVQVPTRSAVLRSSQRRRRRGWKERLPWNT
jgi:hypothetical protein